MKSGSAEFGDLLTSLRRAADLTQEELAERAGISVRAIQSIETGATRSPQTATVRQLADGLGLSGPVRTRLLAAIRRRPAPAAPPERDAILGREAEIARIEAALARGERLVTLLGPGGVGKTRLARAIAGRIGDDGGDITWVGLESVQDPADLLPELARARGVGEAGDTPLLSRIAASIEGPCVVVFDNFEHLLAAAPDVTALLAAVPELSVVVTSREALRLRGERPILVDPLPVPRQHDPVAGRADNPAVALFVRTLEAAAPGRSPADPGAAPASADFALDCIGGIVRLLDGLPLAIELAAAQGATLPLTTLATLLETSGLAALARGRRDGVARFATMEAAIGWSADLLPEDAQRLLRTLGAFRGGFTADAIIGVTEALGQPGLIAHLPRLAESNLVQPDPRDPARRLRMLEPVRMFARARLAAAGEETAVLRAHGAWFHRWARGQHQFIDGPDPFPALDAVDADLPNIRAAIAASCDPAIGDPMDALTTAVSLHLFWEIRGRFIEGRATLAQALAAMGDAPCSTTMLDALYWSGYLAYQQSDVAAVDAALARLRPLADRCGSTEHAAWALLLEVLRRDLAGEPPASAIPLAREALDMMDGQTDRIAWYQSLVILANLHVQSRDYDTALPLLREYEAWNRSRQSMLQRHLPGQWLGFALLRLGHVAEARGLFADSLLCVRTQSVGVLWVPLLGFVLTELGADGEIADPARAAALLGAFDSLVATYRFPVSEIDAADLAVLRSRLVATLGEEGFAAQAAEGALLDTEEIIAFAVR